MWWRSLTGDFQVDAVAVILIAAVCVQQPFSTQAVERLPGGHQAVSADADAYVLLLPLHVIRGRHAGAIRLTLIARLLTVCAVTMERCG